MDRLDLGSPLVLVLVAEDDPFCVLQASFGGVKASSPTLANLFLQRVTPTSAFLDQLDG